MRFSVGLITHTDGETFARELEKQIANACKDFEVQYRTEIDNQGMMVYSALIIGREKINQASEV